MRRCTWAGAALILGVAAAAGCGGGQAEPAAPARPAADDQDRDALIPEEKYDEIEGTFARKAVMVSRCHVEGVEAGDVERTEKGHVTVGLTIQPDGRPTDVRVMESSFKSPKVGDCVVRHVSGWTFSTLPRPLETSHTYVLDRL